MNPARSQDNLRMHILKVSGVRSYRDLMAWQKAMKLVADVYRHTESFPKSEVYGLTAQLRRAAISVPSNIAEGQGRASTGEFRQFLGHARGCSKRKHNCKLPANWTISDWNIARFYCGSAQRLEKS
jgi:hypothetical protein